LLLLAWLGVGCDGPRQWLASSANDGIAYFLYDDALLERYDQYFNINGFDITEQDKIDIANYMKLL
jgi:hypothetical protein